MDCILQDLPQDERLAVIKANAVGEHKKFKYQRFLTDDELTDLRKTLTDDQIEILTKKEKLAELAAPFQAEIKELDRKASKNLVTCKNKFEDNEEDAYLLADHESSEMLYYNAIGVLIYRRKLLPSERQTSIVTFPKQA